MKIFICYRRQDSDAVTGRIRDRLVSHYGKTAVFMDIDNIPFGIDFRKYVKGELAKAQLVLAIIGPQWLAAGHDGGRRIDEDLDPVRVELETALRASIPVVPVLVSAAAVPAHRELPPSLQALADINAAPVDAGRDFDLHVDRLIRSVDELLANPASSSHSRYPDSGVATSLRSAERPACTNAERLKLAPFGAIGGLVPFVVKLHNEVDQFAFVLQSKYAVSAVLFGAIAAVVGAIFPYRHATPWKALLAGLGFTLALGIAAAVARAAPASAWLGGGPADRMGWLELFSIF
jgi:hypothetical protein